MMSSRSEKDYRLHFTPSLKPFFIFSNLPFFAVPRQLKCNYGVTKIGLTCRIYFCMVSAHGTYNGPESRDSFAPQTHLLKQLVQWDLSVDNPQLSRFHDKAFG